ncbi:hypothetical protein [Streptomyces sp. NPDC057966]|uniref:MmyB family transcriptional regulator n=1 Tax=Streptomyces sp. NPDC057966 TaxID=3346292 RepID=UPI0036E1B0CE
MDRNTAPGEFLRSRRARITPRQAGPPRRTATRPQPGPPGLRDPPRILEHTPALVLGRRMDILASNRVAGALLTDFDALPHPGRNLARFMFCDETARSLYTHWGAHAQDIVASLRPDAGRHPHDPLVTELVGELSIADEDLRVRWAGFGVPSAHTHLPALLQPAITARLSPGAAVWRKAEPSP